VLDEPTTGLHLADVEQLLGLLDQLVDSGKSVIVIEHHQAVMAHADWIIDLGPGAGHDGGRVVFEGTPAAIVAAKKQSLTGRHLAAWRVDRTPRHGAWGPRTSRSTSVLIPDCKGDAAALEAFGLVLAEYGIADTTLSRAEGLTANVRSYRVRVPADAPVWTRGDGLRS
jgi:ABC-type glutathione transport system ATPase component